MSDSSSTSQSSHHLLTANPSDANRQKEEYLSAEDREISTSNGSYDDEDALDLEDTNYGENECSLDGTPVSKRLSAQSENENKVEVLVDSVEDSGNYHHTDHSIYSPYLEEEKHLEDLQGEEISAGEEYEDDQQLVDADDTFEHTKEWSGTANNEEDEKKVEGDEMREEGELEDLEDGEIIDSDDGIPEMKESISPPPPHQSGGAHYAQKRSKSPNSVAFEQQQPSGRQYQPVEREICRFFLRGNCRNADGNCRFRHTTNPNDRFESSRPTPIMMSVSGNYSRIAIPPPVGPPIPLLSTEFPPPLPIINPRPPPVVAPPVNNDSMAWEQGLKRARELVRRQKGELPIREEVVEAESADQDKIQRPIRGKSPPLAAISPELMKPTNDAGTKTFSRQSISLTQSRRPIASRMVVEAVSHIIKADSEKMKPIPSLIDGIIESPIPPPQVKAEKSQEKTRRDQRRVLSSGYSDPWARYGNNVGDRAREKEGARKRVQERKRRHSSVSSSSTGGKEKHGGPSNRSHRYHQERPAHRHHQEERNHSRRNSSPYSKEREKKRESIGSRGEGNKEEKETKLSNRRGEKDNGPTRREKIRRIDDAEVSSLTSSSSSSGQRNATMKAREPSSAQDKLPLIRRSSSMSSSTSTTSTNASDKMATTLASLLKAPQNETSHQQPAKCRGPRTPPIDERPTSRNSSVSSLGKLKRAAANRQSDEANIKSPKVHPSGLVRKRVRKDEYADETKRRKFFNEDDAPAAYRIPRKSMDDESNHKKSGGRSSSTSSSTSSSSSSSNSSSGSSLTQRNQIKSQQQTIKDEPPQAAAVTICSSKRKQQYPKRMPTPPALDERVDPISSEDDGSEADGEETPNKMARLTSTKQVDGGAEEEEDALRESTIAQQNKNGRKSRGDNILEATTEEQQQYGSSSANSPPKNNNSKEQSRKRREELRQKLQSVEQMIARKRQSKDATAEG